MPPDHVHRPTIAKVVERILQFDQPAAGKQSLSNQPNQAGVSGVQQPIELRTAPSNIDLDPGVEAGGDGFD